MLHSATDEHSSISRSSPRSAFRTLSPADNKPSNKSCECWSSWESSLPLLPSLPPFLPPPVSLFFSLGMRQPVQMTSTPAWTPPPHQPCGLHLKPETPCLVHSRRWQAGNPLSHAHYQDPPPGEQADARTCTRAQTCRLHAHTHRHFTPTHPRPSQIVLPRPTACRRAERRTHARCAAPGVA